MDQKIIAQLISSAVSAMQNSYSPYSSFKVGAGLYSPSHGITKGCNVENAAYSVCNCAERTALFSAVSQGVKDFTAICVVGGKNGEITDYTPPCGVCRQALLEFANPETFQIILAKSLDDYKIFTLDQLVPEGFSPAKLK